MGHMLKSRLPTSSFANEKQEWQLNGEDMTIDHIAIPRAPMQNTQLWHKQTVPQLQISSTSQQGSKNPLMIHQMYDTPTSSSAEEVSQLNFTYHKCYRWVMWWLALTVKEWILCICWVVLMYSYSYCDLFSHSPLWEGPGLANATPQV